MATTPPGQMKLTLSLTSLTSNAMALIAPGAFLWLTFAIQANTGTTSPAMWIGILTALLLCLATAVCYAEMAKLFPGTGSSYYFAEQAFLNHEKAWRYARISKFIVGWALPPLLLDLSRSHGRHHGHVVRLSGRNAVAELYERLQPRPGVHDGGGHRIFLCCRLYRPSRGEQVNCGQHRHQRDPDYALVIFSVLALSYRINHPPGSVAYQFDSTSGEAYTYEFNTTIDRGQWRGHRHDRSRCRRNAQAQAGCRGQARALSRRLSRQGRHSNFLTHPTASPW